MINSSFAGFLTISNRKPHLQIENFPSGATAHLVNWRIDYAIVDWRRNGLVGLGSNLNESNSEIKCFMMKKTNVSEIILGELGNEHVFEWKEVKSMAMSRDFLFILTVSNRLFGVVLENTYNMFRFGKTTHTPIGKVFFKSDIQSMEKPIFEITQAREFNIESIHANEFALFLLLSNGKIYSIGFNMDGAAARGVKNVQEVNLGECEINLKRKKDKIPFFVKILTFKRKVAAITSDGRVFLSGSGVLYSMGASRSQSFRNVYSFKQLELSYDFIDLDLNERCITAMTRENLALRISSEKLKIYGRESNTELEETERKIVKYLDHDDCEIIIYDDYSATIRHNSTWIPLQFSRPICYPNDGSIYELECAWIDDKVNYDLYFYWKFNMDRNERIGNYSRKLLSLSNDQLLTDISIQCHYLTN